MNEVRIRPVQRSDMAELHALRTCPGVIWGTTLLQTATLSRVEAQFAPQPQLQQLAAEVDGRLAGHIYLILGQGRSRHSAMLGIYVHDEFQGMGLGKRLMAAILALADDWLMLERVWLQVFADNERAIRLYESMGFVHEGRSVGIVRRDGRLVDALHMGRCTGRAAVATGDSSFSLSGSPAPAAPAGLQVRPLRPADGPALYALQLEALEWNERLPTWSESEALGALESPTPNDHLLVAELEGRPIGLCHLLQYSGRRAHIGRIERLAVAADWRGRGVEGALARAAVDLGHLWLGLERIEVSLLAADGAALTALTGVGFVHEVTERAARIQQGRFADTALLAWLAGR